MVKRGTSGDGVAAEPPTAHSIVEERLYLLTVRCACGAGPYEKVAQTLAREGPRTIDLIRARCPRCASEREFRFDVTGFFGRFYPRRGVSDTEEPSQLLDGVAWIRWARMYLRAFEGERAGLEGEDRVDCGVLALRCLDEALKLFPRGDPRLDEAALFTHGSAEAFRSSPDRFGRYEVLGLKMHVSMLLSARGIDPDGADRALVPAQVAHMVLARGHGGKTAGAGARPEARVAGPDAPPPPALLPAPPEPGPGARRALLRLALICAGVAAAIAAAVKLATLG